MEMKWQEPPSPKSARSKWTDVFTVLRQHPGKWAVVAESANGSEGYYAAKDKADIERKIVRVSEKGLAPRYDVYMRAVQS